MSSNRMSVASRQAVLYTYRRAHIIFILDRHIDVIADRRYRRRYGTVLKNSPFTALWRKFLELMYPSFFLPWIFPFILLPVHISSSLIVFRVHIRYEATQADQRFSLGISMRSLIAETTDANWNPKFLENPGTFVHRLVDMREFSIYLNPGAIEADQKYLEDFFDYRTSTSDGSPFHLSVESYYARQCGCAQWDSCRSVD